MAASEGMPPAQPFVMLAVRFLLELTALAACGWAGWRIGNGGISGAVLGGFAALVAGGIWGAFTVPGDPSRNPKPVIAVPGWLRIVIEYVIFGLAAWALWGFVSRAASETFLTVLGIITLVGWDRLWWMLRYR